SQQQEDACLWCEAPERLTCRNLTYDLQIEEDNFLPGINMFKGALRLYCPLFGFSKCQLMLHILFGLIPSAMIRLPDSLTCRHMLGLSPAGTNSSEETSDGLTPLISLCTDPEKAPEDPTETVQDASSGAQIKTYEAVICPARCEAAGRPLPLSPRPPPAQMAPLSLQTPTDPHRPRDTQRHLDRLSHTMSPSCGAPPLLSLISNGFSLLLSSLSCSVCQMFSYSSASFSVNGTCNKCSLYVVLEEARLTDRVREAARHQSPQSDTREVSSTGEQSDASLAARAGDIESNLKLLAKDKRKYVVPEAQLMPSNKAIIGESVFLSWRRRERGGGETRRRGEEREEEEEEEEREEETGGRGGVERGGRERRKSRRRRERRKREEEERDEREEREEEEEEEEREEREEERRRRRERGERRGGEEEEREREERGGERREEERRREEEERRRERERERERERRERERRGGERERERGERGGGERGEERRRRRRKSFSLYRQKTDHEETMDTKAWMWDGERLGHSPVKSQTKCYTLWKKGTSLSAVSADALWVNLASPRRAGRELRHDYSRINGMLNALAEPTSQRPGDKRQPTDVPFGST
ncbi:hypothetical protein L3Q82_012804, partial [Scortum barcoo]